MLICDSGVYSRHPRSCGIIKYRRVGADFTPELYGSYIGLVQEELINVTRDLYS